MHAIQNIDKPVLWQKNILLWSLLWMVGYAVAANAADGTITNTVSEALLNGKSMTSFRLRYEHVNQDGLDDGNGVTLRSLIGWQTAAFHDTSVAAQLINVAQFQDNFNDGVFYHGPIYSYSNHPGMEHYAKIADPDYTGINQLYVESTAVANTKIRAGRQQVNLDNVRFIGDVGFRQVMQVYDGVSALNQSLNKTAIYLAHFEAVRQINTEQRSHGALEIANIKYLLNPSSSITGYAYFSSFDNLGFGKSWFGEGNDHANQSNRTLGMRLDGSSQLLNDWKLLYTAEYANQQDYAGGDSRIDAHYYRLGLGAANDQVSLRVDQELLSSNNSTYAFQTPFGTNHLFQGWVDKFVVTPKPGIQDTFVTATCKYGDFTFFTDYHWINSDERFSTGSGTGRQYGTEWDAAVTYNINKALQSKLEYGKYVEKDYFGANRIKDTERIWITLNYTL